MVQHPQKRNGIAALALAVIVALVCIAELGAQVLLPDLGWLDAIEPIDAPPGFRSRPGFLGVYQGTTMGATVAVPLQHGNLGERLPVPLPQASTVVIGSSYVYALGVVPEASWHARMPHRVGLVANLGLPGQDMEAVVHRVATLENALRGKTVIWAIQSDDLRRSPMRAWLGIGQGWGRYSALVRWARMRAVPKGRDLLDDPSAAIDAPAALGRMVDLSEKWGFSLVLVRLSAWGDGALERAADRHRVPVIDVSETFDRLIRPGAPTVHRGDPQLNARGHEELADALVDPLELALRRARRRWRPTP